MASMKPIIIVFCFALTFQNGALAGRSLLQQTLPTLGSSSPTVPTTAPTVAPVPAPGPSLAQGQCALGLLQQSGNFTTLLDLIQAASESGTIQNLLNSAEEQATIFAPTDGGIEKTLAQKGISADTLLNDPEGLTNVLEYHILPSQLRAGDFKDGSSFNTLYEEGSVAKSVAIQGSGLSATIVGAASSAPIISELDICDFKIFPIDGLLLFT